MQQRQGFENSSIQTPLVTGLQTAAKTGIDSAPPAKLRFSRRPSPVQLDSARLGSVQQLARQHRGKKDCEWTEARQGGGAEGRRNNDNLLRQQCRKTLANSCMFSTGVHRVSVIGPSVYLTQYSTFFSLYLFTQLGNDCDVIPHDTEFRCGTAG